jgi:hypothetical protein
MGRRVSTEKHWTLCDKCNKRSGIIFDYFYCLSCLPANSIPKTFMETEKFTEKMNGAIIIIDEKKQEKLPEPKFECGGKLDFFCKKMGSKYSNETKKYVYFSKCEECFAYTELLKTTLKEHAELKEKIIILVEN